MSQKLERWQWIAPIGLVVFVALLEYTVFVLYPPLLKWPGRVALGVIVIGALALTCYLIVRAARTSQRSLERRNNELLALHRANLDIYGELSLEDVLQRVVDQACRLLECRYGALAVLDTSGTIEQFLTHGIDKEQRDRIGPLPQGKGLLGVSLKGGERLRIADLESDPRAVGYPAHHPMMQTLLAVPISSSEPFKGNLYVCDKFSGQPFTFDDEETLIRFADQAALAIEKAFLHRQLSSLAVAEERARIAREMHDGVAQVLAYVNTKAQAVREYLRKGETESAGLQLEQLAEAARGVYTEVREGILALRTKSGSERSLKEVLEEYLSHWREQSGVTVSASIPVDLAVGAQVELQLLRIIQEALSNVRKHSGVHRATLEIHNSGGKVVAVVRDQGNGFDRSVARQGLPRFGLAIMRERAESVGGSLTIESEKGTGTTVRVELPSD